MKLSDEVRKALSSGHPAHLVTINKDGSPQVTMVWVGLDGDDIVCGHLKFYQKLQNIQRDPRVTLSVETGGQTGALDNYLIINGRARITEGGAPELLNKLAQTYIQEGAEYVSEGGPEGYITHITPERISGVGPWGQGN
ncbi:PPOX class F420-dependent oxidoreductase [Ktedonospora formicarum]|uniref:PPOX class F420-dependent enzyme n=1 Tax=Ktedonospora formicarum TaxID=2778364 RepID=A0A8J3MUP0_9CHLR|nr:PPOX class F420-dependent oxidoreductase [Ktedonospora formicarum]GHO48430.1 PPOX class F420-dependent enzyme [Ktedonospora formicarum]